MNNFQLENFIPKPFISTSTTTPPKIIDLKFKLETNLNDGWQYTFDTIEISFVFENEDMNNSSRPKMYHIEIIDLDNENNKKSYIIDAKDTPYKYWQRAVETEPGMEDSIEGGIVNGRIFITPINDFGLGKTSSFLMPMKSLNFIDKFSINTNPTTLILAKYWHLFSKNPNTKYNRPKQMHIYVDVSFDKIYEDKYLLGKPKYAYDAIGDWSTINNEMYRWIINEGAMQKLTEDGIKNLTEEEIDFILKIIDSINDTYRLYLNSNRINQGDPHVFKIAIINPMDHNDSIIIYLMKGKRWEL